MICWCILIISFSAAAVNKTSAENCPTSAGVILINKNKTIPKEYLKDFNEIEKVLSDQAKSKDKNFILEEILPHNYVPKISSAENGEIFFRLFIKLRQGRITNEHTKHCSVAFNHQSVFPYQLKNLYALSRCEF